MKALFVGHDHTSPHELLSDAFRSRGYTIEDIFIVPANRYTDPNVAFSFPDPEEYDVIVPLGSPWGVWEDDRIGNWLLPELEWLRAADTAGVPVLGVCFGGQLLARAHGGSVARAPECEIGWTLIESDQPDLVESGPWFQYHFDRWIVPPGAREVGRNAHASQAFVLRKNLALQFHPELTTAVLRLWLDWGGLEEVRDQGIDPAQLLALTESEESAARARADQLVESFLTHVAVTR